MRGEGRRDVVIFYSCRQRLGAFNHPLCHFPYSFPLNPFVVFLLPVVRQDQELPFPCLFPFYPSTFQPFVHPPGKQKRKEPSPGQVQRPTERMPFETNEGGLGGGMGRRRKCDAGRLLCGEKGREGVGMANWSSGNGSQEGHAWQKEEETWQEEGQQQQGWHGPCLFDMIIYM